MKVRTFYEKIRKFFCLLFDISLSSGAFVGFMVHSFEFESELLDKLWLSLYTLLLFSIAIRYLLTFWESGLFLFILFVPLLGITGYYFLICCWFTNKFICIGGFVLIFGIIMGLSHCLYICTRNSKYFLYLLSDIVALCSIVIQASSLQVGDIDKNGFFHIGITLYMFFFHFAFSEVTKSSQSKIKKN
ncbi:Chitin synthase export chaperone [Entamoeba marina]